MERFVQVTKPAAVSQEKKNPNPFRYHPYSAAGRPKETSAAATSNNGDKPERTFDSSRIKPHNSSTSRPNSSRAITKGLLSSLKSPSNPLTNEKDLLPSEHVVSCVNGHQRGEHGRGAGISSARGVYFSVMSKRLIEQEKGDGKEQESLFGGLKVYVNGYSEDTTRSEIVRLIAEHGGASSRFAGGGVTHIVTSRPLSGSKTQKQLTVKSRTKTHVVKPEWVFDSIKAGKRMKEWDYTIVHDESQGNLGVFFDKSAPKK